MYRVVFTVETSDKLSELIFTAGRSGITQFKVETLEDPPPPPSKRGRRDYSFKRAGKAWSEDEMAALKDVVNVLAVAPDRAAEEVAVKNLADALGRSPASVKAMLWKLRQKETPEAP